MALLAAPSAWAQGVTAHDLLDRAQIQDLITHYYYNFGHSENPEAFPNFYAEDAELILGTRHFKGRDGIAQAYGAPRSGGASSAPSSAPSPSRSAFAFNVTISNPLIVVHGDTASSRLIFTEYLIDKQGDAPHVRTQGREYATFVKVHGRWLYKTRAIVSGTEPPDGWKE